MVRSFCSSCVFSRRCSGLVVFTGVRSPVLQCTVGEGVKHGGAV